ncbi:MAG: hypothetical protein KF841_05265 [Phycisphaerae bacterium]|nr:hypothetical protein [Phycisphaerae bacterium]
MSAIIVTSLLLAPWAGGLSALANPPPPAATTRPMADSDVEAEREAIDAEIQCQMELVDLSGEYNVDRILGDSVRLDRLAKRIGRFTQVNPAHPASDRFRLTRWEAMYFSATLRGESLDAIFLEIDEMPGGPVSSELRDEAEYWRLRIEVNRVRSLEARGLSDGAEAIQLMRQFVLAHSESPYAVPLCEKIIEHLGNAGQFDAVDEYIALLEKYHPRHPITKTMAGRQRLRRAVGLTWQPALIGLDGRPMDWNAIAAKPGPTFVVFWSPRHGPAEDFLKRIVRLRDRDGFSGANILTIALARDASEVAKALDRLNVKEPAAQEKRIWRSGLCEQYGIRTLPTVLMLDEGGKLRGFFEPRSWNMQQDFDALIQRFETNVKPIHESE